MNGMGSGPLKGMGDIAPASVDPMERYFRIIRGQVQLPRREWIVSPQWTPPVVPGMEAFQRIFEEHELPRQWQLAEDLFVLLQRGRFMVKNPNWIEAPITAEMADIVSETPVAVQTTNTEIISYTVPDRCVASFKTFGHMLDDSDEWGNAVWNILVNKRPVRTYQDFKQQRGNTVSPTPFPKPITLKGRDKIQVMASNANAVNAIARLQGFVIAAETVTQDGSYKDWMSR